MSETVSVLPPNLGVLSSNALAESLQPILQSAFDAFHLQHCSIWLVDARNENLALAAQTGTSLQGSSVIAVGEGTVGAAAKQKRIMSFTHIGRDTKPSPAIASMHAEVAVPLMVAEEVIGVLDCQSNQPNAFTPTAIEQMKMFCSPAALAIKNAQRFAREQRRRAQLEAVNAVARETSFDLDQLLDRLCEVILHNFPADQVSIVWYDEGYLTVAHFRGKLTSVVVPGARLPEDSGLCARALATGAPVLDNQVRDNSGYIAGFEETHSEVCLPLISFSEPLGALVLDSAKADAFDPEEIHAMQAAADVCATAIQNARHFERARNLANVDGLTGIYNRRYFEQRILEELERSLRYNGSLSLLMIDIDNFKKLNDEFGHLLGDEVLRQVSSIFEQHLRKLDVVCRYGGEEFAILVPETHGNRATAVAEKLRKIIESWNFPGVPRPVTISIGVAEFPSDGRTRDELMKAADDALYSAKQQGRNRVVAAQRKLASSRQPS